MKTKIAGAAAALALGGLTGGGIAAAAGIGATASRLDDGKQFVAQARIGEQQAIAAAQTRASGAPNEVDLEYAGGRLVFNVDVGAHDVKVAADTGQVLSVDADD